jgi:DNA polymerase-3 subunit alpha
MAAIMTRRRDQITEITKLMDECKQMGIATLGPDVNESYLKFGVNHKGEIRFGLAAIKGMGDSVAEAIIKEREANGPYTTIFNFAERVSLSVNRKAFESLVLSGGFDSFGIRRETFFAEDTKGQTFLDLLVRYGQNYAQAKNEAQNSLFGAFDDVEIATPPIPKTDERWSDIERLNKERDLVGIYLSAHPLDEYKIVLENLCNTQPDELADNGAKMKDREDVTLGGIVTGVRHGFSKNGKPYGIVTIEDFHGSGELALFGDDWAKWNGWFIEGAAVYVTGKMKPRYFNNPEQKELKVMNVELLQSIKEKAIDRITISLNSSLLNEQIVNELHELVKEHPGKTKLFFQLRDTTGRRHVLLRSKQTQIDVRHSLIDYIERTEGLDYKIN